MFLYYWYMRDRQNNKGENPRGAAKRDERQTRRPPSERKRLAEHLNANEQQIKDLRSEMRQSVRPRRAHERTAEKDDDANAHLHALSSCAIEMCWNKDSSYFTWVDGH